MFCLFLSVGRYPLSSFLGCRSQTQISLPSQPSTAVTWALLSSLASLLPHQLPPGPQGMG